MTKPKCHAEIETAEHRVYIRLHFDTGNGRPALNSGAFVLYPAVWNSLFLPMLQRTTDLTIDDIPLGGETDFRPEGRKRAKNEDKSVVSAASLDDRTVLLAPEPPENPHLPVTDAGDHCGVAGEAENQDETCCGYSE